MALVEVQSLCRCVLGNIKEDKDLAENLRRGPESLCAETPEK